ncbi:MAG: hypothetical protein B7X11_04435, partial [Acidobacteria bacterium 37-65-4]
KAGSFNIVPGEIDARPGDIDGPYLISGCGKGNTVDGVATTYVENVPAPVPIPKQSAGVILGGQQKICRLTIVQQETRMLTDFLVKEILHCAILIFQIR